MAASSGDDELPLDVFQEPADYYQPDKPHTFVQYTLQSGSTLSLRLLGQSPLWVCQNVFSMGGETIANLVRAIFSGMLPRL